MVSYSIRCKNCLYERNRTTYSKEVFEPKCEKCGGGMEMITIHEDIPSESMTIEFIIRNKQTNESIVSNFVLLPENLKLPANKKRAVMVKRLSELIVGIMRNPVNIEKLLKKGE